MPNKKDGKSSADYYKENPASKAKKLAYQKEYNKRPDQVKKRSELVKLNRQAQAEGRGRVNDKLDVSHQKGGRTVMEPQSKNRGSNDAMPGDRRARPNKKKK